MEDRRRVDAALVQALPTECSESVDVLDSFKELLNNEIISEDLYEQLKRRVDLGVKKYGSRLKTYNGRDTLLDCRQEALDGIMYGQQAVLEGRSKGYLRDRFIAIIQEIDQLEKP